MKIACKIVAMWWFNNKKKTWENVNAMQLDNSAHIPLFLPPREKMVKKKKMKAQKGWCTSSVTGGRFSFFMEAALFPLLQVKPFGQQRPEKIKGGLKQTGHLGCLCLLTSYPIYCLLAAICNGFFTQALASFVKFGLSLILPQGGSTLWRHPDAWHSVSGGKSEAARRIPGTRCNTSAMYTVIEKSESIF